MTSIYGNNAVMTNLTVAVQCKRMHQRMRLMF